jgi:LmbE family N-acetylglucosaminyl deacetylase
MNPALPPPGTAEAVRARSVLVVAPHYDDEVLGCGGLLAQLAAAGSVVRVLFLTDGAGGAEPVGDRAAYARARRAESAVAGAALGLRGSDHSGIPDGRLERHLAEAQAAIRRALLSQRPDVLLVPSPLEVSADHRAAFAAVHRLLAPLRGEDDLDAVARDLQVLVYEVNRPAHPDLLVDVGAELPRLEAAMAGYASQEARHPYLRAARGLRRFRTLSLGPEVEAAEGYRRLRLADFVTRGPAALVRELGGVPDLVPLSEGPTVSVVVRTKDRPRLLGEALSSLAASTYRRVEVVVVNDGGARADPPADFPFPLERIDLASNQGRAAAANAGVAAARGDYVAFLDDDDLFEPEHLETLVGLVGAAEVRVAYTDAAVGVYELDPAAGWSCRERRLPYSRDFDPDLLLFDNYIPFNTLLVERRLFAEVGAFDVELPFFEDWDFLIRLAGRAALHHLRQVTCEYRHFRGGAHHVLGAAPRERADFLAMKARVLDKHAARRTPAILARVIDRLRAEEVGRGEEAAALRRAAEERRAAEAELLDRFHRVNGELEAVKGDRARLEAERRRLAAEEVRLREEMALRERELQRLYDDERALRAVVGDQTEHLRRTYAEIERLNRVVAEMEATRAWRLHRWLEGRRPRS